MNTYSNGYEETVNATEVAIFCDENGVPTGEMGPKLDSHHADTQMHLAFSVYVFNEEGQLLVTQRADTKKIWHGVWSNTCCGHLGRGETTEDAIKRRLAFELNMEAQDFHEIIPSYTYKTPPYDGIIEHEYCPVYVAKVKTQPNPNPNEVKDYKWLSWQDYIDQITVDGDDYTDVHATDAPKWSWWCKDQTRLIEQSEEFSEFLSGLKSKI